MLMTKREWWDTVVPPTVEEDEDGEAYTTRFAIPGDEQERQMAQFIKGQMVCS